MQAIAIYIYLCTQSLPLYDIIVWPSYDMRIKLLDCSGLPWAGGRAGLGYGALRAVSDGNDVPIPLWFLLHHGILINFYDFVKGILPQEHRTNMQKNDWK